MKRIIESHQEDFFYAENVEKYLEDAKNASKVKFNNFLNTLNKLNIQGKYLEIGSGPGTLTQIVAKQHPNVKITAMDISQDMIKLAQQDLDYNLQTRINYVIGDACNINSIKDLGEFDLIYSTFTMHHWDNAEIAIKNLFSMLKDNGALYIFDLKRVFWLYYFKSQSGFFKSIRASYQPEEIRLMLNNIGIAKYKRKTIFPLFMQSLLVKKLD